MSKEAEYLNHKKETLVKLVRDYNYRESENLEVNLETIDISHDFCQFQQVLCSNCGGCCKTFPCTYSPYDFLDIRDKDYMRRILDTGVVTLVNYNNYYPYVIRNRGVLDGDYVAGEDNEYTNNTCILLGENGCMLEDQYRASQGLLLIPSIPNCFSLYNDLACRLEYERYNSYLEELFKEYKDVYIPKEEIDEKRINEFVRCLINKK